MTSMIYYKKNLLIIMPLVLPPLESLANWRHENGNGFSSFSQDNFNRQDPQGLEDDLNHQDTQNLDGNIPKPLIDLWMQNRYRGLWEASCYETDSCPTLKAKWAIFMIDRTSSSSRRICRSP